jgi:preprotein translocase subunit SecE
MAKDQGLMQLAARRRTAPTPTQSSEVAPAKPRVGPMLFLQQVRAEARKITWTSWKETWITSVMVGIMVVATAFFFFGVDWLLGLGVSGVLKLANAG